MNFSWVPVLIIPNGGKSVSHNNFTHIPSTELFILVILGYRKTNDCIRRWMHSYSSTWTTKTSRSFHPSRYRNCINVRMKNNASLWVHQEIFFPNDAPESDNDVVTVGGWWGTKNNFLSQGDRKSSKQKKMMLFSTF